MSCPIKDAASMGIVQGRNIEFNGSTAKIGCHSAADNDNKL